MKNTKLFALLAFALLLTHCKETENAVSGNRMLTEVTSILKATDDKFIQYNTLSPGDPKKAIEQTKSWLQTQPTVAFVESVDSVIINITLKSGLETSFFINETNIDGFSLFRGGGNSNSGNILAVTGKKAKNDIKNKNVLIYAPAYSDFYKDAEMQKVVNILNKSGLVTTTLMKDLECSYEIIPKFKDYGLVIIDTHGGTGSFRVGNEIDTAQGNDEEILKLNIAKGAGPDAYAKIKANELILCNGYKYTKVNNKLIKYSCYNLKVTSKYIDGLPKMPETVIFGNMCYSGYSLPVVNPYTGKTEYSGIGTAFISKEPISYYCYIRDNKRSSEVEDGFAKSMEESLVRSLLVDGDSTGIAHLDSEGKEYFDPYALTQPGPPSEPKIYLYFRQFGAPDYSYYSCNDVFTDNRDGNIYKSVCMGKQVWMGENLRYNAPGSAFYNDDPANGPIYGKLYDYATVMNGAASTNANPSGVQGICPNGWHVPSAAEWDYLNIVTIGNKGGDLKDLNYWKAPNLGATDLYGFSARGGGFGNTKYEQLNFFGLWTTTHGLNNGIEAYQLQSWTIPLLKVNVGFNIKISCRCVKN